jgi:hypothetical protein
MNFSHKEIQKVLSYTSNVYSDLTEPVKISSAEPDPNQMGSTDDRLLLKGADKITMKFFA